MRPRFLPSLFLLALVPFAGATNPPAPKFPDWPVLPPAPDPMPDKPKPPISVSALEKDQLYVVQSDLPVQLLASPAGIVSITEEVGPLRIRGKFVDGGGKTETRTYEKKQVFLVERVAQGDVELLMVPKGDVVRRTITDAQKPIPPPIDPVIPPGPPVPVTSFRVIFVMESGDTLTAAQNSVIYGKTVEDFLLATCTGGKNGFRRRDKDLGGELDPTMAAMWAAIKPEFTAPKNTKTPAVAIQVNEKIDIIPLAATPAAMVATLKKYSEGK